LKKLNTTQFKLESYWQYIKKNNQLDFKKQELIDYTCKNRNYVEMETQLKINKIEQ